MAYRYNLPPEEDINIGNAANIHNAMNKEIHDEMGYFNRYQISQPAEYEQIRYSEGYRPTNRWSNDVPNALRKWRVRHRTARNAGQRAANNNQRRRVAASRNAWRAIIDAERDRAEMAKYAHALREDDARMKEEAENAKRVCGPRGCFGRLGKTLRKRANNMRGWWTTQGPEAEAQAHAPKRRYGRVGSTGGRRQKTRRN